MSLQDSGKYFSGNYYVKFGQFSGKNRVKFRNFVNFSGKYNKNSGIFIIFFGTEACKIRAFCFSYIFSGKNVLPPKVDRAPTPMRIPYYFTKIREKRSLTVLSAYLLKHLYL